MMKKKKKRLKKPRDFKNPVAKHMGTFNKPATHKSAKDYKRKEKHQNKEDE